MTDPMQQAREQFEVWMTTQTTHGNEHVMTRVGNGDERYLSPLTSSMWAAWQAALRAAPEWQPIETAPEGRLVVVGWLDTEDSHYPENYEFDYLEGGLWAKHEDCVEHAHAVAPPGSKMPKEQPPYKWWMDLPVLPAARPQGVKHGR